MTPPRLLQEAWQVKRWGVLPEAGGLRDQPAGLLAKMATVLDVYTANKAYYDALMTYDDPRQLAGWESRNNEIMTIVRETTRLREALKKAAEVDCGD
jgi:hypothetical protein